MVAAEGIQEIREATGRAYRLATELQDLQDQGVEVVDGDMHEVRVKLWNVIELIGGEKTALRGTP